MSLQMEVASTSSRCCAGSSPISRPHAGTVHIRRSSRRGSKQVVHVAQEDFSLYRGETPVPKNWRPTVVPGVQTVATPLLSADRVAERLLSAVHPTANDHYGAFFSSELGGIVTDPALMLIHMDDHMVHRGHGVFDTVLITDGHLYQLPQHIERFKQSAELAGLEMWRSDAVLMRVLLDTAAASRKLNGIVKFWLTPGRGGFGLDPDECTEVGFYALATSEVVPKMNALDKLTGYRACTSAVPPNKGRLARVKSNNYLRNTLALTEAQDAGFDVGLFVDEEGHILEGPNMNVGIITQDDVFVTPPFDNCLAGVTIQRIMELIPVERERSPNDVIVRDIQQRPITVDDMLQAKEAFLTGSTTRVMPIVSINDEPIGEDGAPGITALAFDAMLVEDMKIPEEGGSSQHIPVPYGRNTGMLEHLR